MSSSHNVCRLCLKKFTEAFTVLNRDVKAISMLKHLFPGMNVNLVEKSKICNDCYKYIQFSYTLRDTVVKNEQKVNSNMDLIKIIEETVCRLCLSTGISEGPVFLYESVDQTMPFLEARSILEIATIELHFELFQKPVACNSCWKIIKSIYLFKKRCFATEKILKFYCTKNNLTSLTNKDVESVSICYNLNLQKFSKGEQLDVITNLIPRENIDVTFQATSSLVHSIIKPVDVYLNNFTTEDDDDVFEEEINDIFIEDSKIIKEETLDTLINVVKEEGEQPNIILDEANKNMEENNKAAKDIKSEEVRSENNTPKDIPDKSVGQSDITNSLSVKKNVDKRPISVLLKDSPGKNKESVKISSSETLEQVTCLKRKTSALDKINSRIESADVLSNTNNTPALTGTVLEESNKKVKNLYLDELRNFKRCTVEIENGNIEQSDQSELEKLLEHSKKGRKKLENLKLRLLEENNDKRVENQEQIRDGAKKRKKPFEDIKEGSKNISKDNHEEVSELINNKARNKSENEKCKDSRENNDKSRKTKPIIKKKIQNHDDTEWSCKQCEFTTKYKHHLKRHGLIHNTNAELLTCYKCVYSTQIKRNLERHMLVHASENFVHRAHCTYLTVTKSHLMQHMLIHQECDTRKDTNPKQTCNTDAETKQSKTPFSFRCKMCPFVTNKEGQIMSHLRTHKSQDKIFTCAMCHYITTKTHSFKNHMELHTDSSKKKFKCELCSFTGKRHTHLVSHMLTHQKEFKFNCSQCSYKAKRKSHLVTHMLRHQSGDKKIVFQCPYCKYQSIRREHLKGHCRNLHSDKEEIDFNKARVAVENDKDCFTNEKKTAICPFCRYRSNSALLNTHIFTVHFPSESKEMQCNECSYRSNTRKSFLNHISIHRRSKK